MKFSDKYPDIKPGEIISAGPDFILRSKTPDNCWNCTAQTEWIDVCFEAHVCSDECSRTQWAEYAQDIAEHRMPETEGDE